MSDRFEDEVRTALRSGVSDELSVAGLADGARSKLRRRRRAAVSIVGAAALVAAVPVGLAALNTTGGSGNGTGSIGVESAEQAGLPAGWHWESYANIEFGVPDSWKHGSPNQWCVGGDLKQAWVSRPNEAQTLVACLDPTNGYGAVVQDAEGVDSKKGVWEYPATGHEYPEGAWMTTMVSGDLAVSVATPDRATTEQIADSFRTFDLADANGCPPRQDLPQIGTVADLRPPGSGPIVLCRYAGTTPGDNLAGSEGLSADRAQALLDALATAKADGSAMPQAECAAVDPDATLILRGGDLLGWAFNTMCSDSGVDVGGDVLPMSAALMEALYGFAPTEPTDGGVVTEDPDGSVSNDGTITPDVVVPPDTASPPDSGGSGSSGSSGGSTGNTGSETTTK
jgi:hypothetical protein